MPFESVILGLNCKLAIYLDKVVKGLRLTLRQDTTRTFSLVSLHTGAYRQRPACDRFNGLMGFTCIRVLATCALQQSGLYAESTGRSFDVRINELVTILLYSCSTFALFPLLGRKTWTGHFVAFIPTSIKRFSSSVQDLKRCRKTLQ